jgi:hypothetical protein
LGRSEFATAVYAPWETGKLSVAAE